MKTLVGVLSFLMMAIVSFAQSPVNIKLNLQKGKTYAVNFINNQTMQQSAEGQQVTIDIKSQRFSSFKVLNQEKDIMDIEFCFDTIASKVSNPMFARETNSAKPGKEPIEKVLNKFSKAKLICKISTTGKFIGFVNQSNFKDEVLIMLDSVPASSKDAVKKQAEQLVKESALKSMIEPIFAYLPETAVKKGDKWETSYISTSSDISSVMMNSFILDSVEGDMAAFSGKSEMESLPSMDPNAQVKQDIKGSTTFEGTIDITTGLALKRTEKGHYEGSMTVKSGGQEMVVPLKIDSKSETTFFK
jgi:hypothetical protein